MGAWVICLFGRFCYGSGLVVAQVRKAVEVVIIVLDKVEEVLHFIYRFLCRPGCVAAFEFFAIKPYVGQGFRERDLCKGTAVGVLVATVLEQSAIRRNHQVAFGHHVLVLDIDNLLCLLVLSIGPVY